MTFATESRKRATEKATLARIQAARDITPLIYAQSPVDDIYSFDFSYHLVTLQMNETLFTEVAVGATLADGEYYYNQDSGEVYLKTTVEPDLDTNVVILTYYLFYADTNYVNTYVDPTSATGDIVHWESRIKSVSSVKEDLSNSLYGILSISNGSISLSNPDGYFQQFLSDSDSFRSRQIVIWQSLGDPETVSNCKRVYTGSIDTIRLSNIEAEISYSTELGKLKDTATMGDTSEDCYYLKSSFPNINPANEGQPIPYMFGSITKYKHVSDGLMVPGELVDPSSMYDAACISYNPTISVTTNRTWALCRVGANGTEDFSNSIAGVDNTNPANTRLQVNYVTPSNGQFWHGMSFTIFGGALTSYKVLTVTKFSAYTHYVYVDKDATLTTSDSIVTNDCPSLYFYLADNDTYYPLKYADHYTATTQTTKAGNKIIKVILVDDFESLIGVTSPINPDTDKLYYRVLPNHADQGHGTVIKDILAKAGITVQAASVTSANSYLPTNANFSIPMFDESDYGNYFDYVEKILLSSFSILAQQSTGEIAYSLLTYFGTSSATMTDDEILRDTFEIEINYNDIITSVVTYNPNFSDSENDGDSSVSMSSNRSEYLHQTVNTLTFKNVLESMTDPVTRIIAVRSERLASYLFDLKLAVNNTLSTPVPTVVGNQYLLSKNKLLGSDTSRLIRVLGINKNKSKATVKAVDLYNLTTVV